MRAVADTVAHTIEGNAYPALAFRAQEPQDVNGEIRRSSLSIDNVGRELIQWVEESSGGRGATMRVMRVLPPENRGGESTITWEVSMGVGVTELTNEQVTVALVDEPLHGRPAVMIRHDPETSPGLF